MTEVLPRPAASVLLLRDGPSGLEVFMVVRHAATAFASGALVFPGGSVDDDDRVIAATMPGGDILRIAAIRETFEEAAIVLATDASGAELSGERACGLRDAYRGRLIAGEVQFSTVLSTEGLALAPDQLQPFAHWITPPTRPKRFDTHFFLAAAPAAQLATHDGHEGVHSAWVNPMRAIEETAKGLYKLVFATRMNLLKLARYPDVEAALAAARLSTIVTVVPEMIETKQGRFIRIPAAADYGSDIYPAIDPPAM
jgi:8-oxo-dGTP pyrophosphatase MutT (NUDIX family)